MRSSAARPAARVHFSASLGLQWPITFHARARVARPAARARRVSTASASSRPDRRSSTCAPDRLRSSRRYRRCARRSTGSGRRSIQPSCCMRSSVRTSVIGSVSVNSARRAWLMPSLRDRCPSTLHCGSVSPIRAHGARKSSHRAGKHPAPGSRSCATDRVARMNSALSIKFSRTDIITNVIIYAN